jgi:hypothetical protein
MRSIHHFVVSAAVGAILLPFVSPEIPVASSALPAAATPALVVAYAAVLGVGIDVDHFLVARYNAGDWRAVRFCLQNPSVVFVDQDAIFESGEVWPLQRLLTHAVGGGVLVAGLLPVSTDLAVVSAVVLYAHLLADLLWDNWHHDRYLRRAAGHAERR